MKLKVKLFAKNNALLIVTFLLLISLAINIYQVSIRNDLENAYQTLIKESDLNEDIIYNQNIKIRDLEKEVTDKTKSIEEINKEAEEKETRYFLSTDPYDIKDVNLYYGKAKEPLKVDNEKIKSIAYQSLRLSMKDKPEADIDQDKLSDLEPIYIEFKLDDIAIQYTYYFEENVFLINGNVYYADSYLYLAINEILNPDSVLAEVTSSLKYEDIEHLNNPVLNDERLLVNGMDYVFWERELTKYTKVKAIPYYSYSERVEYIEVYEEGIVKLELSLVFLSDTYQTKDGIKIGLTEAEVEKKLGKPNMKHTNIWSYQRGDYHRFHLIFEDGKVKYLEETIPL